MVDPGVSLFGREFLLLDVGGVGATIGLGIAFVVSAARNTVALYREEPLPQGGMVEKAANTPTGGGDRKRTATLDSLPWVTRPDLGQPQLAVSPRRSSRH